MRISITVSDDLLRLAQRYSGTTKNTALVEEALRTFVEVRAAEERKLTYAERLSAVQEALAGRRYQESASLLVRQARGWS